MDALDCPFRGTAEVLRRFKLGRVGPRHRRRHPRRGDVGENGLRAHLRWANVDGGRHPHALPQRRRAGAAGRHGVPVRRGHVRRLRQRHRHEQGRRGTSLLAQNAWRAARAGGGPATLCGVFVETDGRDGVGSADRAGAHGGAAWPRRCRFPDGRGGSPVPGRRWVARAAEGRRANITAPVRHRFSIVILGTRPIALK